MTPNLFTNLPTDLPEELFTTLLQAPGIRIERIVSHGHQSPDGFWYDQPTGEWVIVLKGAARIDLDGKTVELKPGDYLDIPAHSRHRVEWTTPDDPTPLAGGALRWRGIAGRRAQGRHSLWGGPLPVKQPVVRMRCLRTQPRCGGFLLSP